MSTATATTATRRIDGIDLARGLAVCTMVVAHTSPSPIDLPAEYLTAPLFALLIGVGLSLGCLRAGSSPGQDAGRIRLVENLFRGLVLLALGIFLQRAYDYIDVVLPTLGLLTIALAPVVPRIAARPRIALAGCAALWLVSPVTMNLVRDWLMTHPVTNPDVAQGIGWLLSGYSYRLTSHLVFGLGGVALGWWLHHGGGRGRAGAAFVAMAATVTLAAYALGRVAGGAQPYAGDHAEILGSLAFAAGTTAAAVWLCDRLRERPLVLRPLLATGRMALTAYTVQVLLLAGLQRVTGVGWDDDQWWVLGLTLAVCVFGSWAWSATRLPGPLEGLLRLPRLATR